MRRIVVLPGAGAAQHDLRRPRREVEAHALEDRAVVGEVDVSEGDDRSVDVTSHRRSGGLVGKAGGRVLVVLVGAAGHS